MNFKKVLSLIVAGTLLFSTWGSRVYAVENAEESTGTVPQESVFYEVQKGDCLWRLAKKFLGDGARYTDIVAWNEELIRDPSLIYPGAQLRIMADKDMEAAADSYQQGTISGTTWRSEWLGMQLELPEGFEFRDGDEYFEEINVSDEEDDLSDDSYGYSIVEFMAVNPSALYSGALLGIEQTDYSIEEYVEKMKSIVDKSLGIEYDALYSTDYEWGKKGTEKIGGRSFEHYYVKDGYKEEYMYFAICLDYYITKIDDKIVILFTAYIDMDSETSAMLGDYLGDYYADHRIDELLDGFSAYLDTTGVTGR